MNKKFQLAQRIANIRSKIHKLKELEKKLLADLKKMDSKPSSNTLFKKLKPFDIAPKEKYEDLIKSYLMAPTPKPEEPWFGDIIWD
jgi:hypothetical protein